MATLSSQRINNTISWSLQLLSRSRTVTFSFSSTGRGQGTRPYSSAKHRHTSNDYTHGQQQRHRYHHARFATPSSGSSSSCRYRYTSPRAAQYYHEPSTKRFYATSATSTSSPAGAQLKSSSPPSSSSTTRVAPSGSSYAAAKAAQGTKDPPPPTARSTANENFRSAQQPIRELAQSGLSDAPAAMPASLTGSSAGTHVDWTQSFHGLSTQAFSEEAQKILLEELDPDDIEIKPDGIIYLPEIKYRRILNRAFGPGGWGLAPRGETIVTSRAVTREYALVVNGRLVSIARGEQDYFDPENIPTASEGCKSNALMRCCKDLGIASELWDPRFIRKFLAKNAKEVWVEHATTKKRRKLFMRKDDQVRYPYKEAAGSA